MKDLDNFIMEIFGVKYNNLACDVAIEEILRLLKTKNQANLFFLNSDCLYKAELDLEYRNILNSADLVLPDGIGLRLAALIFGGIMKENCNGTDLSPVLMKRAAEEGYKMFFLGGREGIAEKAAINMKVRISEIKIVGSHSGYFDNDTRIIEKINNSGADILFVAMGVPLQEKWIYRNRAILKPRLCLGVGALLDYLSGTIPRAPNFMRFIYLEWLWRIFIDPKRMIKRYIIDGSKFFWLVVNKKFVNSHASKS